MKKREIEIMGYFMRSRDGNEYILYKQDGELYITSGVNIWNNQFKRIEKKYLPQLSEVDRIDIEKMARRLEENYKYESITTEILEILNQLIDKPLS